ncbi:type II toxin-antitoxin system PemK/MazF family toxin [Listeria cornellensis]|uniref:PpGpp-regulated growth inhibitor n=1 Tax=Listeria cornellensis FSL F6-0969 TaxID=1265820 RepID=W7BKN4_9LIST|nr:type II toxin-antitoxin system PemK/MazF family toxin [Listeria cornellensis]EUJ25375.1 ppGpp-regulated growth inhibitor [Listeria cornellensis FSL F6-0969]
MTSGNTELLRSGQIIMLNLSPTSGHRTCLVLSDQIPNSNMVSVAAITSTIRRFPLHIDLPEGLITSGQVLLEQNRMVDANARGFKIIEEVPLGVMDEAKDLLSILFDI